MARNRKRNRAKRRETMRGTGMAQRPMMPIDEESMPMKDSMGMGMGMRGEEDGGEPESNVSPEEQAIYEKVIDNYEKVMYGKAKEGDERVTADDVRQSFDEIQDPIDALSNAAVTAVDFLARSAEQAGKPIPGDILMHAGEHIIRDLADLAEAGGHYDYKPEEITGAFTKAVEMYRDMNQDKLNKDEIAADYQMLVQADKEGRLDEVLPGASDAAEVLPEPDEEEMMAAKADAPPQTPPQGFGRA